LQLPNTNQTKKCTCSAALDKQTKKCTPGAAFDKDGDRAFGCCSASKTALRDAFTKTLATTLGPLLVLTDQTNVARDAGKTNKATHRKAATLGCHHATSTTSALDPASV
jgi:hypothetical protein